MKNSKNRLVFIILSIALLAGGFYWVSIRPQNIKKQCADQAKSIRNYEAHYTDKEFDNLLEHPPSSFYNLPPAGSRQYTGAHDQAYSDCLHTHGL